MSELFQKWSELKKSEQSIIIYGLLVILIAALYFYAWVPYNKSMKGFQQKIAYVQEDIIWLKNISMEIEQLKSASVKSVGTYSGSLINVVDKSIKKNKLNKNVSLLEKKGADKVVIQFNKIAFDDLIKLMGYITRRYGILIKNIDIQRDDNQKLVNSRVILKNND